MSMSSLVTGEGRIHVRQLISSYPVSQSSSRRSEPKKFHGFSCGVLNLIAVLLSDVASGPGNMLATLTT